MKCNIVLLVASLTTTGLSARAGIDLSKLPSPAAQQGVTYEKDIRLLFEASCVRCHSGDRPKAGLRLNSLEGVLHGSKDGKVVVPGSSEKSPLVVAVSRLDPKMIMPPPPRQPRRGRAGGSTDSPPNGTAPANGGDHQPPQRPMPPPPKPLTPQQVGLIRAWIDQGAK